MTDAEIKEFSQIIRSSNLNFLFGAGVSTPFLPILGAIETEINNSYGDPKVREEQLKKYIEGVMFPNKKAVFGGLDATQNKNYADTLKFYMSFFEAMSELVIRRKSTILSKQVNLFTTNIDVLLETALEELQIDYNDGFAGRLRPLFNLANFKKATFQRSLHFDHVSEVPVFNIIKMHGSLTWMPKKDDINKIVFAHHLEQLADDLISKNGDDFLKAYKDVLVVNPEEAKHLESVLNVYYYELLRLYSSSLEKENALLFILGFSMEDRHIREITLRAAKSNPTLRIFLCCSQNSADGMRLKMEASDYSNIQILTPEDDDAFYTLDYFTSVLKRIRANHD